MSEKLAVKGIVKRRDAEIKKYPQEGFYIEIDGMIFFAIKAPLKQIPVVQVKGAKG